MSLLSLSVKFIRKAAALMLLSLLASSCQWITDDYDDETAGSNTSNYINLTLHVKASSAVTRANPTGGEDGDGREKGVETRENLVEGVTVIFYQNDAGINASAESATATTIDFAAYYSTSSLGSAFDRYNGEMTYTTGERELDASLDVTKTYHILVVANADLTSGITAGTTTLAEVRDKILTNIYTTVNTSTTAGVGTNAQKFVMTSESSTDDVITFGSYSYNQATNRRIFTFDNIHIERMAARIDYWAANSNGYKTKQGDNTTNYQTPGYEYTVKKPDGTDSQDRFVLTRITPFNLNNGNEYILKRTNDTTNPYLHGEVATGTGANWVLDPNTSNKKAVGAEGNYTSYDSKLADVISTSFENEYTVTMADQQNNKLTVGDKDNIIVGYAKENTLSPGVSPLYYHATGLAFEGYYFEKGTGTGQRYVFYYFIRHQGENDDAYQAFTSENINTEATKALLCPTTPTMNFGIVRNNIYRISVDHVTSMGGTIKIVVKEMRWRHVDNPPINI